MKEFSLYKSPRFIEVKKELIKIERFDLLEKLIDLQLDTFNLTIEMLKTLDK